jgi:serine O-acetyltransferase
VIAYEWRLALGGFGAAPLAPVAGQAAANTGQRAGGPADARPGGWHAGTTWSSRWWPWVFWTRASCERDPAARSAWEVLTCYPGLHALVLHRLGARVLERGWRWLGRFTSHIGRFLTGIEIHPGATIGRRVFIDHGMGVVIGETAEIGDDCTIYQGVTLGGTSLARAPSATRRWAGRDRRRQCAKVLGGFTVGDGARVGSNAVVLKPVPPGATAVGNPARIILAGGNTSGPA